VASEATYDDMIVVEDVLMTLRKEAKNGE